MSSPSAKSLRPASKLSPAKKIVKIVPANMAEVSQVTEQFLKLACAANELKLAIADSERRTAELKANMTQVQKQFEELRPRLDGVVLAFDANE